EIEAQISGVKAGTAKQNVGTVREIGDGVAKIEGLTDAMLNEMLDFGNGITGLALNLEETEVGAIILGDYTKIEEGSEVRTTGKTTIGIDTIISQARLNRAAEASGDKDYRPLYCIYVAVGQKQSNVARVMAVLEEAQAMPYTIIISATASDSATNQYLAPFAGAAMGEWFMDNGMDALIIFDDLSKHAVAYRQVSLVLKRPSGREAYPGDVFYLHSRLLERSARIRAEFGGG